MADSSQRFVRVRTAEKDRKKALDHYQDLRRSGVIKRAVVIGEREDGSVDILGQGLKPADMAQLLVIAAHALADIEQKRTALRPEAHVEPVTVGIHNQSSRRANEIKTGPDGCFVPPSGENFISCGECNHPHWMWLQFNNTEDTARMACSHCGNEVKAIPIHHQEGRA